MIVKLVTTAKAPRPPKAAIAALRDDPALAPEFDAKYGPGSAARYLYGTAEMTALMGDLLERIDDLVAANEELVDQVGELVAQMKAPKRVLFDQEGNVIGSAAMQNEQLRDVYERILAEQEAEQVRLRKERDAEGLLG